MDKTEVKKVKELARALCNFSANTICPDCADDCFFKEYARRAVAKGWCRQSEWISVEERLPERTGKYLVFTYNGRLYIGDFIDHYCDGNPQFDDYKVTHWMPLPEPPKKDGGE